MSLHESLLNPKQGSCKYNVDEDAASESFAMHTVNVSNDFSFFYS